MNPAAHFMQADLDSGRYFDEYLEDLVALGATHPYGKCGLPNHMIRQLARELLSLRALTHTTYPRQIPSA